MRWSLAIGSVKGTQVRVHFTFFLFLAWLGAVFYVEGGSPAAIGGLTFFLLLFLCVVLHEFGHVTVGRHFGVRTAEIVLLPIGGVAQLDRIPERPREELLMALAGPAVTLIIAGILVIALGGFPDPRQIVEEPTGRSLLAQLAYANLTLLLFNILPVFPLDGGRVLRALLSAWMGHLRGTQIAASIGKASAVLLGLIGFSAGHIILVLIALFVYVAASAEAGMVRMRRSLAGVPAHEVMVTTFACLAEDSTLSDAAEALVRTSQYEFPVIDDTGRIAGSLTRDGIVKALSQRSSQTPVKDIMDRDVPTVTTQELLDHAIVSLEQGRPLIAVLGADGQLAGMITLENLAEQLMLAKAVDWRQRTGGRTAPARLQFS